MGSFTADTSVEVTSEAASDVLDTSLGGKSVDSTTSEDGWGGGGELGRFFKMVLDDLKLFRNEIID